MRRSFIAVGSAIVACAGIAAAATLLAPEIQGASQDATVTASEKDVVGSATYACPEIIAGKNARTWVSLYSVPGVSGQTEQGSFQLELPGDDQPVLGLIGPGTLATASEFESGVRDGIATALDGLAPGSGAARTSLETNGESRGLASTSCRQAVSSAWLLGGATQPGQRDRALLFNPTDSNAVVDVSVVSEEGTVDTTGTDGLSIPAHEKREVKLDAVASGLSSLAIHVQARSGLVAPFVLDDTMEDLTPRGVELIGPAGQPTRKSVIVGIPSGGGSRELLVLSPKSRANVQVSALTPDGTLEVAGGTSVAVEPGHLATIPLTKDLKQKAAALVITSDVPVLATSGVRSEESAERTATKRKELAQAEAALDAVKDPEKRGAAQRKVDEARDATRDGGSDVMWMPAADPLASSGVVGGILSKATATVHLLATDGAAQADISVLTESGITKIHSLTLEDGQPRDVQLKAPGAEVYAVLVGKTDGDGTLRASVVQRGQDQALTGLTTSRVTAYVKLRPASPVFATE